jgi:diguanylate cyclase (GGDEF)-like protein
MRHRQRPLKLLFTLLSFILLAAFLAYAYSSWREVHDDLEIELGYLNRILNKSTADNLSHYETILRILGNRLMEAGVEKNSERSRQLLEELLEINPELGGYGLARSDGQLLIVSGIEPGKRLPNLLDNPDSAETFRQTIQSARLVVGRTYYFDLLEKWITPIRIAIRDDQGNVALVMTSGVILKTDEITWNAIEIPEGSRISLVRQDGFNQLTRPTLTSEEYKTNYNNPLQSSCMQAIIRSYNNEGMTRDRDCGAYIKASIIPSYNLYSVLQTDISHVRNTWLNRMLLPVMVYLLLFGSSIFVYLAARKMQLSSDNERARHEQILLFQANHDELTLLPNRMRIMDRLEQSILDSNRTGKTIALLFLDLDNFKTINDTLGHLIGDALLKQAAERLNECVRATDTVARLGGDEFLILLREFKNTDDIHKISNKILEAFRKPFQIEQRSLYSTASIGISMYPGDGNDAHDLLKTADTAMYQAKDDGRNRYCFFSSAMNERSLRRMEIENHLRKALANNEFSLVYQPQVQLTANTYSGVETLLRWNNPELGMVSPAEFIPVAEETGLINDIGLFVLDQSIKEISCVEKETRSEITLAMNVSAMQLQDDTFLNHIENIISSGERAAERIECEITETMVVDKTTRTREALNRLYQLGVKIAIDDFGTGYSSLSYLAKLPVNTLKIDQSFIFDTPYDFNHTQLTQTIIAMSKGLGLEVIAEGVENTEQANFLIDEGCDFGQGYLYARPMPANELIEFINTHKPE